MFTPEMKQVVAIGTNVPMSIVKEVITLVEPLGVTYVRKIRVSTASENHRSFLISIGQQDQLFPTVFIDSILKEKLKVLDNSNNIDDLIEE